MPKTVIAGNWKMNLDKESGLALATAITDWLDRKRVPEGIEVVLCPASPVLPIIHKQLIGTGVKLGAQNVHRDNSGPFTGEISAPILKSVGCQYVIIGHSERRMNYAESDLEICYKVNAAVKNGLYPIICVGELETEREDGRAMDVVRRQVRTALDGVFDFNIGACTIAYEPVWAIGTGKTATPEQAEEMHTYIREIVRELYSEAVAAQMSIIYGGSVTSDNAAGLFAQPNINGALVGGASLRANDFLAILGAAITCMEQQAV